MTKFLVMIIFMLLGSIASGEISATSTASLDALQTMIEAGEFEQAVAESETVLTRWEREFGPRSLEVAQALDKLGLSLYSGGRAAEPRTMEIAERAISIKTELLGPEHLDTATSKLLQAYIFDDLRQSAAAIESLQNVLAIRIRELGPDHELVGDVHGALGRALVTAERLQDARVQHERKIEILEAAGPDNSQLGGAYTDLATVCRALGDLSAAVVAIEKGVANLVLTRGPSHPHVITARYTSANILMEIGKLPEAMAELERAQESLVANDMMERAEAAAIFNAMGRVSGMLGDYASSQEYCERALQIEEAIYGPDYTGLSYYLNNLGSAAALNGDFDRAEAALQRSVNLTREQLGPDHMRTISCEYSLAMFESRQEKWDEAEKRFTRCLEKLSAELGDDHPKVAMVCGDLSLVKEQKHLMSEAGDLLDRALANRGAATNPTLMAELQFVRARIHLRQRDYQISCEKALNVERDSADRYRLVVQTLSESASQQFAAARTNGLAVALSALLDQDESTRPVALVWDRVIQSRGLLLDELSARRRLVTTSGDPEIKRLADEVFTTRSRLADMYVRGGSGESAELYEAALQSAREDKAHAEAALAVHSADFRSTAADRLLGLADIRDALPDASALVAWQRFQRINTEDEEAWYCAFVLANDGISVIDLGPAGIIDDLIEQWRYGLLEVWAPGGVLAEAGIAANRELGARLRDLVWTPCAAGLAGVQTVFIVPDGDLHLLPLAALPSAEGGYLLEDGPTFHYLSREKSLVRQPAPVGSGLLAIGDPAFDGRVQQMQVAAWQGAQHPGLEGVFRGVAPDCERLQAMRFSALPGTRRECEQVGTLMTGETQMLLGAAATEAAFKAGVGGQRIVHLATHGYFLGSDCPSAAAGYADDPLLLSGLALAGANLRAEAFAGQEDGIVTAEEISLLDLKGVEWVVLSACDTGLGVLQPGEGVYGLQRAFETAGAGTVIMSLWPVEDQATQQWMSGLYGARLREGLSTPAAVRRAALDVLQRRRAEGLSEHPFWWAGFVAAGDWR